MANDAQMPERIARIIRENLSGVTSIDPDIRAAQEDDLMRTAELIAADLCASGQQVRALTRAAGDERKAGWIVSLDDLQAIRAAAGDWGYGIDLEAVEAIALDVERRILAALTPDPQPEAATPTAQEAVPVADGSLICCPRCGCFHERGACVVWG